MLAYARLFIFVLDSPTEMLFKSAVPLLWFLFRINNFFPGQFAFFVLFLLKEFLMLVFEKIQIINNPLDQLIR